MSLQNEEVFNTSVSRRTTEEAEDSESYAFYCLEVTNSIEEKWKEQNKEKKVTFDDSKLTSLYTKFEDYSEDESVSEKETFFPNFRKKFGFGVYFQSIGSNFSSLENVVRMETSPSAKRTSQKDKKQYIIEELKETEKNYISGLEKIVEEYIPYINKNAPQNLISKIPVLFGNIEEIYKSTKSFLKLLEKCGDNYDMIAQTFIDNVSEFELYPLYAKNKPTADIYFQDFDAIIKERQIELDERLSFFSYLLTPIQRLGKYVLLLQNIEKELKKDGQDHQKVTSAISVVENVMRKGNDYIAIDSIKKGIDLTDKGSFITRSVFTIQKPKKFLSMVFLFEEIVVFTKEIPKQRECFNYFDSIPMSDLSLAKFENKPTVFELNNYIQANSYTLEAESPENKNMWTETIEKILWSQFQKEKAKQKKVGLMEKKDTGKVPAKPKNSGKYTLNQPTKNQTRFYVEP